MIWLSIFACNQPQNYQAMFDGPIPHQHLTPDENDVFSQPVGFVSNARSGRDYPH